MLTSIRNKSVIITGGTKGIGKGIAGVLPADAAAEQLGLEQLGAARRCAPSCRCAMRGPGAALPR